MLTIIIRCIIVYTIVLIVFRVMGKRQLGEMQPFELVLTLVIADLATIPMSEMTIPLLHGIVPLLTLLLVHFFLTILSQVSNKLSVVISGKPVIIINPEGINYKALKQLNITIDDLAESLRSAGYFSFEMVHYAIMETNGVLNILPKAGCANVTCDDLKIKNPERCIPTILVSEGTFMEENAEKVNISKEFIEKIIKDEKIKSIKQVLVLTLDNMGNIYFQTNYGKCKTIKCNKCAEVME